MFSFICNGTTKKLMNSVVSLLGKMNPTEHHIVSHLMVGPAQPCGPHSAVLPWAIAAVSLIVNVICIICLMILWYVITASFYALRSLSVQWRPFRQHIMSHSFFSPKEHKEKDEAEPRGPNLHVTAANRPITTV